MSWEKLLIGQRFGQEKKVLDANEIRSQFQRDYDRIVFAPAFRRLQNKTQVFPLPGPVFVHNRLTHSLEVASVGRSIARLVVNYLSTISINVQLQLLEEIPTIVSTACLCHDLGNPPFGHSGEDALSKYFREGEGAKLQKEFSSDEWKDLCYFEGNANALRLLTHQFKGRRKGGFALTYSTLASIIKYPYSSTTTEKSKYGHFRSEKEVFDNIMSVAGLQGENECKRHPLVFLVEAADDISYLIMDMEDAHRLGVLTFEETFNQLIEFVKEESQLMKRFEEVQQEVTDHNEIISFLRSTVINKLVHECANAFIENYEGIMDGVFTDSLAKHILPNSAERLKQCKKFSIDRIYNHRSVVKIELAGYHILGTLLDEFVTAILNPNRSYSRQILSIVPNQYELAEGTLYNKMRNVLDFISGMTDTYAVQMFRDIRGIDFEQWPV